MSIAPQEEEGQPGVAPIQALQKGTTQMDRMVWVGLDELGGVVAVSSSLEAVKEALEATRRTVLRWAPSQDTPGAWEGSTGAPSCPGDCSCLVAIQAPLV